MSEEALLELVKQLRLDLEFERSNRLFSDELHKSFEEALGPHKTIPNGCWIIRAHELRLERDRLLELLQMKDPTLPQNQNQRHCRCCGEIVEGPKH